MDSLKCQTFTVTPAKPGVYSLELNQWRIAGYQKVWLSLAGLLLLLLLFTHLNHELDRIHYIGGYP